VRLNPRVTIVTSNNGIGRVLNTFLDLWIIKSSANEALGGVKCVERIGYSLSNKEREE